MKKIFSVLCVLAVVLVGCAGGSSKSQLEDGVLTVGMECDYAPYNWTTTKELASESGVSVGSGSYCDGYDVAVSKMLAEKLGVELEIKKMSWDGLIPAVNTGKIDVIIAGMSPTAERKQTVDFSDAYYTDNVEQVLMVKKGSAFENAKTLADLKGAKLSGQLGTFQYGLLTQANDAQVLAPLDAYSTLMQSTTSGVIDGYIAEISVAQSQAASNPDLSVVTFEKEKGFIVTPDLISSAIGIKKGSDDFVLKLNEALGSIDEQTRIDLMTKFTKASEGIE